MKDRQIKNPAHQQGAALVVGLVLLMVLTVLGISTMRTATLEATMAGNAQFQERAFRLAETGVDVTLAGVAAGVVPINTTVGWRALGNVPAPGGEAGTQIVRRYAYFDPPTPAPGGGYSIGSGTTFSAYHYSVDVTGSANRGSQSRQLQGFWIPGPNAGGL